MKFRSRRVRLLTLGIVGPMMLAFAPAPASAKETCPPVVGETSDRPALAWLKRLPNEQLVVYRGKPGDNSLYFTKFGYCGAPGQLPGASTSHGPALAWFAGRLYLAWKDAGGGAIMLSSTSDGISWAPPRHIVQDGGTSSAPTMAAYRDTLYIAWKGINDDQRMFMSWSLDGFNFGPQQQAVPDAGTSDGPSMVSTKSGIAMAWKGVHDDQRMFYSRYNGWSWAPQLQAAPDAGTSHGPSLTTTLPDSDYSDDLRLVYKGVFDDVRVFTAYLNPHGQWIAQEELPRDYFESNTGPAALGYGDSTNVMIGWKGSRDNTLYGRFWNVRDRW
ncbi:hypothetical protein [Amycolatopsis sp. GA6-003]|uniref:hypothetical protein n=1 Tax=Amycolatopsis sp. GA6-003 TaxID=2652444 RepID=UPI0039174125